MPSQFPNGYDTFLVHSDPQSSDMTNVLRYKELKQKTTLTTAEETELNTLATTLRNKLFLAEDWNLLSDAMSNMQVFVKDTILQYYNHRGDWTATPDPAYTIFNTVRYTDGQIYLALQTPGSTAPTDATVWLLIGKKGDEGAQGPAGANLVPRGAYDSLTAYSMYDLVTYDGDTYYAKQATTGNLPSNATYWEPFVSGFGEDLSQLNTTHKASIVGAINEVNTGLTTHGHNVSELEGTLTAEQGGTGIASYTTGDILYAQDATTLVKLAKGQAGQVLSMKADGTVPEWANVATRQIYLGDETETQQTGTTEASIKSFQLVKSSSAGINISKLSMLAEMRVTSGTGTMRIYVNGSLWQSVTTTATSYGLVKLDPVDVSAWVDNAIYALEIRLVNSGSGSTYNRLIEFYVS